MTHLYTYQGKRQLDEVDGDGRRGHHMKQYVLSHEGLAALLEKESWFKLTNSLPEGTRILMIFESQDFNALVLRCEHPDFPFVLSESMISTNEHIMFETWNA